MVSEGQTPPALLLRYFRALPAARSVSLRESGDEDSSPLSSGMLTSAAPGQGGGPFSTGTFYRSRIAGGGSDVGDGHPHAGRPSPVQPCSASVSTSVRE